MLKGVSFIASLVDARRSRAGEYQSFVAKAVAVADACEGAIQQLTALGINATPTAAAGSLSSSIDRALEFANIVTRTRAAAERAQQELAQAEQLLAQAIAQKDQWLTRLLDALLCWLGRVPAQQRVDDSQQDVNDARAVLTQTRAESEAANAKASIALGDLRAAAKRELNELRLRLENMRSGLDAEQNHGLPSLLSGWSDPMWSTWRLSGEGPRADCYVSPVLRLGWRERPLPEPKSNRGKRLLEAIPAPDEPVLAPLIGSGRTIFFSGRGSDSERALEMLQGSIIRLAAMMGPHATFTFIDPAGNGASFPFQRFVKGRPPSGDLLKDLLEIEGDIRRINRDLLDAGTALHELPDRRLASESFEFIVAAQFPRGYDRRMIQTLASIAATGPRTGRYVLIHHSMDDEFPRDMGLDDFKALAQVTVHGGLARSGQVEFTPDLMPAESLRRSVFDQIKASERAPTAIPFEELVQTDHAHLWKGSSQDLISTAIGLRGGHDVVETWFGARDGRTCAHGMLAGMPGSGKSTLYHVLIMGLSCTYSPQELRLYLIDGKFGTEFLPYRRLPHARVVSLNTHPELARSVLQDLVDEMARRNAAFRAVGVEDLPRYRRNTGKPMPRLVLMVDEYQQLFDDDDEGTASDLMRRLAQQGRSAGIHMFLGSQRFGAPGMLHQQDIFGNIHLKMAMKLQPDEVMGLTEFGPIGKALIRSCDVAGKFALNDSGQDDRTMAGRAALLEPQRRDALIEAMCSMDAARSETQPIVLRGDVAPAIRDNIALSSMLSRASGPNRVELETIARLDPATGPGLGIPSWQSADLPIALALGRRLSVHHHAYAVLRRSVGQHLLLIGSRSSPRLGMLCGALVGAIACSERASLAIDVLCAPMEDSDPTMTALLAIQRLARRARDIHMDLHRGTSAIDDAILSAAEEVRARGLAVNPQASRRLLVILDPERTPSLHRSQDAFRPNHGPCGQALRDVLDGGSLVGMHVVLSAASLSQLSMVLDERREIGRFMHRACLQVSEDDSYALFRNRRGAALQHPDDPVSMAICMDMESSSSSRFRPYAPLEGAQAPTEMPKENA